MSKINFKIAYRNPSAKVFNFYYIYIYIFSKVSSAAFNQVYLVKVRVHMLDKGIKDVKVPVIACQINRNR